jgi:hypothetical protein
MFAEFRFQLGRLLLPTSSFLTSWCDDRVVVERIMETAKIGLLQSNAEACQTANCSQLTAQCHREISSNKRFVYTRLFPPPAADNIRFGKSAHHFFESPVLVLCLTWRGP